LRSSFSM